jgi:hypothetical protein
LKEYLAFWNPARDPYKVSFMKILESERELGIRATFFLKAGGNDRRDASYRLDDSWLKSTLRTIARGGHETGLHPSFRTVDDEAMFRREQRDLDEMLNVIANSSTQARLDSRQDRMDSRLRGNDGSDARATSVRQHYLRLRYPGTWRMQSEAGFAIDSTLGFAEHEGFRNGACHPFLCYDHDAKSALPLWEIPLLAMDGTLRDYRGMDPSRALAVLQDLIAIVESVRGCGTILFHNICFDEHDFPCWDRVFTSTAEHIARHPGFLCSTLSKTLESWLHSGGYSTTDAVIKKICNVASGS